MRAVAIRLDYGTRLAVVVAAVIASTLIPLVIALWPQSDSPAAGTYTSAILTNVIYADCDNVTDEVPCGEAIGALETDDRVEVMLFRDAWLSHVANGDRVILYASQSPDSGTVYTFHSHDRTFKLVAFAVIIALVLLVVRGKGIRAIISLIASTIFIWAFLIGGIAAGGSPLLYTTVSTVLVLTSVLFFTHGLSAKTPAAWGGTMCGAATAMAAGTLLSTWLRLGPADESASALTFTGLDIDLSALSLAALLIALIGILNDISCGASCDRLFSHRLRRSAPMEISRLDRPFCRKRPLCVSDLYDQLFRCRRRPRRVRARAHLQSAAFSVPAGRFCCTTLAQMMAGAIGIIVTMPATTVLGLLLSRLPSGTTPPPAPEALICARSDGPANLVGGSLLRAFVGID